VAAPKEHRSRIALAYAWNGLGGAYLFAARDKDATEAYTKALRIREQLAQDLPKEAYRWVELGGSNCNLGNVIVESDGKLKEATPYYDKGIALLEKALKLDPNVRHGKEFLANCFWGKFVVAVRSRQFAEAEAASTRSLEQMHGNARLAREINRELQFAEAGEHARAAKRIEAIAKRKDLEPESHYRIAQVYAVAAGAAKTDERLANAYSGQAVEQLRQFHNMSKYPAPSMLSLIGEDKLLDPLRKRGPFQAWIKELKETPAPKPKSEKPQ
jgi:tetratricopeptide (TPR) repeat protein